VYIRGFSFTSAVCAITPAGIAFRAVVIVTTAIALLSVETMFVPSIVVSCAEQHQGNLGLGSIKLVR
jgi:hypothetical protein